jgi:hypothetical protein
VDNLDERVNTLPRGSLVPRVALFVAVLWLLVGCSSVHSPGKSAAAGQPPHEPVPVTFTVPPGFAKTTDYVINVPLHPLRATQWVVPEGTLGLDVIAVTSYVLDQDVTADPDERLTGRIAGYAAQVSAISATPPVKTSVAGFPAFQQTVKQPSRTGPLTYDATFVFAGHFLVQVICQYDKQPDTIRSACRVVLDTLRITFV